MISATETTFDLICRLAGRDYSEHQDSKNRYKMICPVCNYLPRGGGFTSFSIRDDKMQWHCFACGEGGGYSKMAEHLNGGPAVSTPVFPVSTPKKVTNKHRQEKLQGASIQALSIAKPGLTTEHLRDDMGWQDTRAFGVPAISIPYSDGSIRYRVGITGDRFRWAKGSKPSLYGLDQLEQIRAAGSVLLVEGETDTAAARLMGVPVLGVPGASNWKEEWEYLLTWLDIYVFEEPDQGGKTLVRMVGESGKQIHIIQAPDGIKDLCELLDQAGSPEVALAFFNDLKETATVYTKPVEATEAKHVKPTAIHKHHKDGDADLDELTAKLDNPTWVLGSSFEKFDGCDSVDRDMRRTALRLGKPVNLTTSVLKHREEFKKQYPKIEEFYPLSQQGVKLLDFCFFMENPHLIAPHQQIENLVSGALGQVDLSGQPVPAYVAIVDCGRESSMSCDVHGAAWCGTHKCYQGFDPNCGTQASGQAAKVKIPNLEGSAQYLHVVFQTRDVLPDNADHWGPIFSKQIDTWQKTMAKASMWKAGKDRLYSRSHATYYGIEDGKTVATTTWKILFHEVEEGCLDKIIIRIATAMDAIVFDQRRWQKGQNAALQIVADFMSHFIGIDQSISQGEQAKIFLAHYNSTRGRHIFQAYGLLRKLIIELPAPEPQICPEPGCGLTLHEVLLPRPPSGKIGGASPYHDRRN